VLSLLKFCVSKEEKAFGGAAESFGKQWGVGDVVGVFLDLIDRTISKCIQAKLSYAWPHIVTYITAIIRLDEKLLLLLHDSRFFGRFASDRDDMRLTL
jgi:hypothetical protein